MIEPLESRIAPAALLSFTDSDGDLITVKASKGSNAQLATAVARDAMGNIMSVTLPNATYEGSDFSIVAKIAPGGHGDGRIAVPAINATGTDLGVVSIGGDVGSGDIGSNTAGTPAVKSFKSASIGVSNGALGTLTFNGVVPVFATQGDVAAFGEVKFAGSAAVGNLLGTATIGGALVGGGTANGGLILVDGSAGGIIVKGAVIGGTKDATGAIEIVGSVTPTKVSVGSLLGSSGDFSGSIRAVGPLGAVTVAKYITAGTGTLSGSIVSEGNIASVVVGDSIVGNLAFVSEIAAGANVATGVLGTPGSLGTVTVKGSVGIGGFYKIEAHDNITSVSVTGDLNGSLIASGGNTKSVTIHGDLLFSTISAHGTGVGLGLASATIGGSAHDANIFAGQTVVPAQAQDINATLGVVKVGGEADSVSVEGGTSGGISSQITSITIGGLATAVTVNSNLISKIIVEGATAPLTAGANNDNSTFGGVAFDEV